MQTQPFVYQFKDSGLKFRVKSAIKDQPGWEIDVRFAAWQRHNQEIMMQLTNLARQGWKPMTTPGPDGVIVGSYKKNAMMGFSEAETWLVWFLVVPILCTSIIGILAVPILFFFSYTYVYPERFEVVLIRE